MTAEKTKLTFSGVLLAVLVLGGVWLWDHFSKKGEQPAGKTANAQENANTPSSAGEPKPRVTPEPAPKTAPKPALPANKSPTPDTPPKSTPRSTPKPAVTPTPKPRPATDDLAKIAQAFKAGTTLKYCEVEGVVAFTLPDDLEGHKHQQWVMRLGNNMTVKVAHNIDLAGKVPLAKGDSLRVCGEYIPNERGGVLHWTHHDPKKWRKDGCVIHKGKTYK